MTQAPDRAGIVASGAILLLSLFLYVQAAGFPADSLSGGLLAMGLIQAGSALLVLMAAPVWVVSKGPPVVPRIIGGCIVAGALALAWIGGTIWEDWERFLTLSASGLVVGVPLALLGKTQYASWWAYLRRQTMPLYHPLALYRAALLAGLVVGCFLSAVLIVTALLVYAFSSPHGYGFLAAYVLAALGVQVFVFFVGPLGLLYLGSLRMPRTTGFVLLALAGLLALVASASGLPGEIGASRMLLLSAAAALLGIVLIAFSGRSRRDPE